MIVQLTPNYKFICDRCGKEEYVKSDIPEYEVTFMGVGDIFKSPIRIKRQVCYNCYKDFWEIAENFVDEVNKKDTV